MTFEIGKKFYSIEELKEEFEKYANLHNIHFWKRDVATIHASRNIVRRCRFANQNLIFYRIKYACVYGGREHKTKSFGERRVHSIRSGCPAFIFIKLSKDGNALEVTNLNLSHNHPNVKEAVKLHAKDKCNEKRLKRLLSRGSRSKRAKKPPATVSDPVEVSNSATDEMSNLIFGQAYSSTPEAVSNSTPEEVSNSIPEAVSNSTLEAVINSTPEVMLYLNLNEAVKFHAKDKPNKRRPEILFNASNSKQAEEPQPRKKSRSSPEEITGSDLVEVSNSAIDEVSNLISAKAYTTSTLEAASNLIPEGESNSTLETVSNATPDVVQLASSEPKVELSFKKIYDKNSCNVNVLLSNNELKATFLQDDEMKMTFHTFPEVFFFNRTGPVTDVDLVCFTFVTIGITGMAEVIAIGFVENEDKDSLDWLINTFKRNNENWHRTQLVMTDKVHVETGLFKDSIPQAAVSICRYSTLQIFHQEVTSSKITSKHRLTAQAKQLMRALCDSTNEKIYMDKYREFLSLPSELKKYYDKNWHPIYKAWTCVCFHENRYITSLNDQLEFFNSKLNSYIGNHSNLEEFIEKYFSLINALRKTKFNALNPRTEIRYSSKRQYSCKEEEKYFQLLVPYAYRSVSNQLKNLCAVKLVEVLPSQFYISQNKVLFQVDQHSCDCIFKKVMRLPCKHIFTLRKKMNMSIFDPELVDPRWFRSVQPVHRLNKIVSSYENNEPDELEAVQDENKSDNVKRVYLKQGKFAVKKAACNHKGNKLMSNEPDIQDENCYENKQSVDLEQERFSARKTAFDPESDKLMSSEPKVNQEEGCLENEQSTYLEGERFAVKMTTSDPDTYELMCDEPGDNLDENNSETEQSIDLEQERSGNSRAARKTAALELTNKLAQCIAESSDEVFEERMKLLKDILNCWKTGEKVTLTLLPTEKATTSAPSTEITNSSQVLPYSSILPKPYGVSEITWTNDTTSSQNLEHQGQVTILLGPFSSFPFTSSQSLNHQSQAKRDTNLLTKSQKKLLPFEAFPLHVQQEIILSWFVDKNLASCAVKGGERIEENQVVAVSEEIPASCTHKKVDLSIVQSFFTEDAWKAVTSSVDLKKKQDCQKCMTCGKSSTSRKVVNCLCCLLPCHYSCTESRPRQKYFCQRCMVDCPEDKNGDPLPFENFPLRVKQERILSWFVDEDLASCIVNNGGTVQDTDVVSDPREVPLSCLSRNVDLSIVKDFFSESAWKLVTNLTEQVEQNKFERKGCAFCGGLENINYFCRGCMLFYNLRCIAYQEYEWYCIACESGSSFPSKFCPGDDMATETENEHLLSKM